MSNFRLQFQSQILNSTMIANHLNRDKKTLSFSCCSNRFQLSYKTVHICIRISALFLVVLRITSHCYQDEIFILSLLSSLPWLVLIVFGIVVMWNARKIKEAMLCIQETWAIIFSILLISVVNRLPFFSSSISALIGLFIGIIYLCLHTINYKNVINISSLCV